MNCRSRAGPYQSDVARELPAALSDRVNLVELTSRHTANFLTGLRNNIVGPEPPRATPNPKR
jgi:hypothetical protein